MSYIHTHTHFIILCFNERTIGPVMQHKWTSIILTNNREKVLHFLGINKCILTPGTAEYGGAFKMERKEWWAWIQGPYAVRFSGGGCCLAELKFLCHFQATAVFAGRN